MAPVAPRGQEVIACPDVTEGTRSAAVKAACPPRATGCHRPLWRGRGAPLGGTALPQVDAAVVSPS